MRQKEKKKSKTTSKKKKKTIMYSVHSVRMHGTAMIVKDIPERRLVSPNLNRTATVCKLDIEIFETFVLYSKF